MNKTFEQSDSRNAAIDWRFFGRYCEATRVTGGRNQAKFAKLVGVPTQRIQALEAGKPISIDAVFKICVRLGKDLSFFGKVVK